MWPLKNEGGFNRQNMGKGTALAKASWQVRPILVWGGQLSSLGGVQGLCRPIMSPGSVKWQELGCRMVWNKRVWRQEDPSEMLVVV